MAREARRIGRGTDPSGEPVVILLREGYRLQRIQVLRRMKLGVAISTVET
jgi:hypothetical protein